MEAQELTVNDVLNASTNVTPFFAISCVITNDLTSQEILESGLTNYINYEKSVERFNSIDSTNSIGKNYVITVTDFYDAHGSLTAFGRLIMESLKALTVTMLGFHLHASRIDELTGEIVYENAADFTRNPRGIVPLSRDGYRDNGYRDMGNFDRSESLFGNDMQLKKGVTGL